MTRLIAADRSARPAPLTITPVGAWQEHAACAGLDPNAWFAEGAYSDYEDARETCVHLCPVRAQCLDMAQREGHTDGMYGGLDPKQRRALRRRALPSSQPGNERRDEKAKRIVNARRMALYDAGLSDNDIGEAEGISSQAVSSWRDIRDLPSNTGPVDRLVSDLDARRRDLHAQGFSDREMAELEGVGRNSIAEWRQRRKLPINEAGQP